MDTKNTAILLLSVSCAGLLAWLLYVYFIEIDAIKREVEIETEMRIQSLFEHWDVSKPEPKHSYEHLLDEDGLIVPPIL